MDFLELRQQSNFRENKTKKVKYTEMNSAKLDNYSSHV